MRLATDSCVDCFKNAKQSRHESVAVRLFPQNRVERGYNPIFAFTSARRGRGIFPSTLRELSHSLIYEQNDGRDCHTSAPYRRITSGQSRPDIIGLNVSVSL